MNFTIAGYEIYELLLFFGIYSILGRGISLLRNLFINGKLESTGICKGPYCPSYAIAAIPIILMSKCFVASMWPIKGLMPTAICGFTIELFLVYVYFENRGKDVFSIKPIEFLMTLFGGVILVNHIHPLLLLLVRRINPWVHMVFLLVFWLSFTGDYIEGIFDLFGWHKRSTISSDGE